ncbi:MAG TPA: beta-ribofuranosylaminobenzene 5'-phosphate synthase family protein, partial [Anaerolineales bacterium]|nr:beta-ribofuranosylaminobenzene 5'-phosphate synthase family protein [Anaerolineales bacterium]
FQVTVTSGIPSHTGFGSKTATLLGVGRAITMLCGKETSTQSLANLARRGGTSGIGVNVFDLGGFIVDGGHSVPAEHAEDREIFHPSRFSVMKTIPPVLFQSRFPWPLLIVVPQGRAIQGEAELAHFKKVCPIPREKVHEIAYIASFKMPAAILERNYLAFCEAINALQQSYWKASQIQNQTDELRYVLTNAQDNGFDAIGISSNGPALYGLSEDPQQAERWLKELVREGIIRAFWRTTDSSGAIVRRISQKDALG